MQAATKDTVELACPECLTANRVPAARLGEAPKCGKCGAALTTGAPVDLGESSFDAYVGRTQVPVLVDFWAPWCAPCRAMAPAFKRAAAAHAPRARFAKVNTEQAQALAGRMGIRAIPTLILFKGGKEVDRRSGALNEASIRRWLEPHV